MKLLWNLDNTVAISIKSIESFNIFKRDEGSWYVQAWRNGRYFNVFVADSKSQCINFIDKMEEYL